VDAVFVSLIGSRLSRTASVVVAVWVVGAGRGFAAGFHRYRYPNQHPKRTTKISAAAAILLLMGGIVSEAVNLTQQDNRVVLEFMKNLSILLLSIIAATSFGQSPATEAARSTAKASLAIKASLVSEMLLSEESPLKAPMLVRQKKQSVFYASPAAIKSPGGSYAERLKTFGWKGTGVAVSSIDEAEKLLVLTESVASSLKDGSMAFQEKSCVLRDGKPVLAFAKNQTVAAKDLFQKSFPAYYEYPPVPPSETSSWAEFSAKILDAAITYGTPPEPDEKVGARVALVTERFASCKKEALIGYSFLKKRGGSRSESWSFEAGEIRFTFEVAKLPDGKTQSVSLQMRPADPKVTIVDWNVDGSVDVAREDQPAKQSVHTMDRASFAIESEGLPRSRTPTGVEHAQFWDEKYRFALRESEKFLNITSPR
jgi:hypothetical protein